MKMPLLKLLTFCLICLSIQAFAEKDKWDVNKPGTPNSTYEMDTDEGTWMNLDVSPDGKTIVFDLLGDIYSMGINGGNAKLLRGGHAFEIQPRFSPDGKQICFTSDAGGGDNIWTMNTDGSDAKQVTEESFRLLNNSIWTDDGEYLIARKHFTSRRSLGAGELWMYHKTGGSGVQITSRKNDQQDLGEPCISPDGRYIYFSEDMYPGGYFQYNKDPNQQIYVIKRFDRENGETETLIGGPGGAFRPQISPDGKTLAFVRRVRTKSVLYLYDFESGIQKPVYDQLSKDQQEAWAIFGVYSNFNWCPDNKHVVIWADGKIRKIDVESGTAEVIPFRAKATHTITNALKFEQNPAPLNFDIKVMRGAVTSPDGKTLVFNAVGYLWKKNLPNGKVARLTTQKDFEFEPSFSPDGKYIVYVRWNDEDRGAIMRVPVAGGEPVPLSTNKGIFRSPSYSPDGSKIVFFKEGGDSDLGFAWCISPGIYTMDASGGKIHLVSEDGEYPKFNSTGKRIYYETGGRLFGDLNKRYCSVDLDGNDQRVHFHSSYSNQFSISPDNKWLAFAELHQLYLMPFAETGKTFELSSGTKSYPVKKISEDAGISLQWTKDSKRVNWTLGNQYYGVDLKKVFTFVEGAADSITKIERDQMTIDLNLASDKVKGIVAFVGATIITMNGQEVIENGVIIVENNRISKIGKSSEITIPADATKVELNGKYIMPGFIDTHAHLRAFRYGLSPQKQWSYYANLAYGITATHDPSANSEMALSQSEMVLVGHMVGPRIFSTGTILYGADGDFKAVINSLDDARSAIKRTKAYGAFSVKSYNQPRRDQRQQVIEAAREEKIMVYPEGGSTFFHNMTMILDGHTSVEHNIPVAPLYQDVVGLWAASNTRNTPTLIVNYGGVNGEYYWYENSNVWEEEKLLKYTPRGIIDSRARHRTKIPAEEYENGHILTSQSCKKLVDAGVHVCVGGHGQLQGLGVHWEIWMLSQGGMTNYECLRAATIHGAEYIGMDKHLGSLEVGKLADLIVLDKNPLENIRNTNSVKYTMVNGRMFDTETMNEIYTGTKNRTKFFWEIDGQNSNFPWHEKTHSFMEASCSCRH
jgi:imidazolonepropionase-like amidohydrolase/Tol biopolymer transport system component